jgi:S-adenosylmethionine hydrolase
MPPPVALLTDFGLDDPYVGQLRAVLAGLLPGTPVLDISHGVPPRAVMSGALFLAASRPYFPDGTLFLCVVDPGVGSERPVHCVLQKTPPCHILLGPGNGLLSLAAGDMAKQGGTVWLEPAFLPPRAMSATFHGRDLFPRMAAALLAGHSPESLGTILSAPPLPDWAAPRPLKHGRPWRLGLTVLHVDRFGNCITNLPEDSEVPDESPLTLRVRRTSFSLCAATHYAALPDGRAGLLRGSQGFWELACKEQNAAETLRLKGGDHCILAAG